ncbi:hypothetical protein D3C71_181900 [compost metagenome]
MERLLGVRSEIYDHFHASNIRDELFLQPGHRDRFAQYDTAMLLLQDTGEALWVHRRREFSPSAMTAYIEFWGVVQAVIIQQDALIELATSVGAPKPSVGVAWTEIRDFRNVLVGHPANKKSGGKGRNAKGPLRAFMGRQQKTYRELTYELWDGESEKVSHPKVDLGRMIDAYEAEAAGHLAAVLAHIRQVWPVAA